MRKRILIAVLPFLAIMMAGLLFFGELLVHPTSILYSERSDLLAMHLPKKQFLVESWRAEGELPRWCPYEFAGNPFVHDIQLAIFYPPHAVLYALPVSSLGAALSWLLVVHVILAGILAYLYARAEGLLVVSAIVVAFGYMFAGKWMYHLLCGGHYVTIGLAWLPLVLLCLRRSIREKGLLWSTFAGVAFAMIVLSTHPQWTFYCGLFVLLWTIVLVLDAAGCFRDNGTPLSDWRTIGKFAFRGLASGLWLVIVAVGLSAVQLLPTIEAAGQSTRGHVGISAGERIAATTLATLLRLVGPRLNDPWVRADVEMQGAVSYLWFIVATWCLVLGDRRLKAWFVCLMLLVIFAIGGAHLLQDLPGFRLFRIPSRMLLLATLPLALIVGGVTDRLVTLAAAGEIQGLLPRLARTSAVALLIALLVSAAEMRLSLHSTSPFLSLHPYWFVVPCLLLLGLGLLWWFEPGQRRWQWMWVAVLLLDVAMMSRSLVATRTFAEIYPEPKSIAFLANATKDSWRVLDRDLSTARSEVGRDGVPRAVENVLRGTGPLDHGWPLMARIPSLRGYNPLDVQRYQQFMKFVSDNDQPPRPDVGFYHLPTVNRRLLDLLGVRYLLQPSGQRPATSLSPVSPGAPWKDFSSLPWIPPRHDELITAERGWSSRFNDSAPRVYAYVHGGVQDIGPYTVYENLQAMPRAFWVPMAIPLPDDQAILAALKENDFTQRVFLEGDFPIAGIATESRDGSQSSAKIVKYSPNRVDINVAAERAGYLVLSDPWYPGWKCTVDGQKMSVYRANYAFRAIAISPGKHKVVFTFAPDSFTLGQRISTASVVLVLLIVGVSSCLWWVVGRLSESATSTGVPPYTR